MNKRIANSLLIGLLILLMFVGIINISKVFSSESVASSGVPSEGTVVEGVSVPGISLGFSRADVVASYGEPNSCQTPENSFCKYQITEGTIFITYQGNDGGEATGSNTDVVHSVTWYYLYGWLTTAGINTDLAYEDPNIVINAYPDAILTYNQWNVIVSAIDYYQGIEVVWERHLYPNSYTTVHMKIFYPREPPEPRIPTIISESIGLTTLHSKVISTVTVKDDWDYRKQDAIVYASWTSPNGNTVFVSGSTNAYGEVKFEIKKSKGIFIFTIIDITLDGYTFDPDNSVLSNQIEIVPGKNK